MKRIVRLVCVVFLVLLGGSLAAMAQAPDVVSGEKCLSCHRKAGESVTVQVFWPETAHPMALETLRESVAAENACLRCHSADGAFAGKGTTPMLESAQYGLVCLSCHPGDHTQNVNAEIEDVNALCLGCHTDDRTLQAGDLAHHPVAQMLDGQGAPAVKKQASAHAALTCLDCHRSGHKFAVAQKSCDKCHKGAYILEAQRQEANQALEPFQAGLERLERAHPGWAKADAPTEAGYSAYALARSQVSFVASDGSGGLHNPAYAQAVLAAAQSNLEAAGATAPRTLPATGGPAIFTPWPLLLTGGLVTATGLLIRQAGVWLRSRQNMR